MNNTTKNHSNYGPVTAIIGGQWGDEGKGKLIDILTPSFDIIVRPTGGANAGHTVYVENPENPGELKKHVFHLLPSGILYPQVICIIGNGCVVHIPTLLEEIAVLKANGISVENRLFLSDRAHLVFNYHKTIDGIQEERKGTNKVGTTLRGIGPTYSDKIGRTGIRVCDLLDEKKFENLLKLNSENHEKFYNFKFDFPTELNYYKSILPQIKPLIIDSTAYLDEALKTGKKILLEGANGTMLDVDHGTYPYVTSSNATIGGVIAGSGIGATKINQVIGVFKAYTTRVGSGPFPTELENEIGEKLRTNGGEFGSTTGRPRRCGWFDAVAVKYALRINGITGINLTKLDILTGFQTIKVATKYRINGKETPNFPSQLPNQENLEVIYEELPGWTDDISKAEKISDLPENARRYIQRLEELLDCPVESVGVGIGRHQMAFK